MGYSRAEINFTLNYFPDVNQQPIQPNLPYNAMLIKIIQASAYFFTLKDLGELNLLNKSFNTELLNERVCMHICCQKLKYTSIKCLDYINIIPHFNNLTGIKVKSYKDMFKCLKNTYNLIKNPYGAEGFDNWEVFHGGDQIIIENRGTFKDHSCIFVTSFEWCSLIQEIVVPDGKNRVLVAGVICGRRSDCGSAAEMIIKTQFEEKKILENMPTPGVPDSWKLMTLKFDIGPDPTIINTTFLGKDTQYWKGHYGARIGHCFVMAVDYPIIE
ncbi:hypothetical protein SteCoe_953 [Stentor coeruleus]|uniref:FBA domain-containing protein n=1 Tax=Stentor coeruleus TaxID=5963 RepID=A0A1R2D2P9_9CILI|nr:hypothetical protein SteCoe_953 [Stentor coeruleus]